MKQDTEATEGEPMGTIERWVIQALDGQLYLCGYSEFGGAPVWAWARIDKSLRFETEEEATAEANRLTMIVRLLCKAVKVLDPPPKIPTAKVYYGPPKSLPKVTTSRVRKWHRR